MNSRSTKRPPVRHRWINRGVVLLSGIGVYFLFQTYLTNALGLPPGQHPTPDRSAVLEELKAAPTPATPAAAPVETSYRPLLAQASLAAIPLHTKEIIKAMDEGVWPPPSDFKPTVPKGLESAVRFWEMIYATYDSNQVVFHDTKDLSLVYGALDFNPVMASPNLNAVTKERFRNRAVADEEKRLQALLETLASDPQTPLHDPRDLRIRKLLGPKPDPEWIRTLADPDRIRSQTGLKDRFARALATSGLYMKEMETIFDSYGLPWPLTRMVFVESMFRLDAVSHSGAVGLWQFMRGTAKRYMTVNNYIDERYDPFTATHAAARLFLDNYRELKSWPLTVNAYNVGRGRMRQAVEQVGTTDISTIIHHYSHPDYGFASRNFYPEFLAAFRVEQNAHHYFGSIRTESPLEYEVVNLPKGVRLTDLASMTQTTTDTLFALNPALRRSWWRDVRPLPARSRVRVPKGMALRVEEYFAVQ